MSELTYHQNGDYLIPDLELPDEPRPLGKYGRMRREFLKEHRPISYSSLVATVKLHTHLLEIEDAARLRLEQMMPVLMEMNNVTEGLKAADPLRWVGEMNNLKAQAEEVILTELVYS
ncbi:MAG: TnpV protein [Clostridia bacterium]|nr:TnpV protein [Clostridia bacterium]